MRYSGFAAVLVCLVSEVKGFSSSASTRKICELKYILDYDEFFDEFFQYSRCARNTEYVVITCI
jgi:hypothetical protein